MRTLLRSTNNMLEAFGIDLRKTLRASADLPSFLRARSTLKAQATLEQATFPFGTTRPMLGEASDEGGSAKGHYFHQDLLVARRINEQGPVRHVDVGSRIDGFVAHVASFRDIEVLDIRPTTAEIPRIRFAQFDLMAPLPDSLVGYCDSLSCLHALEHLGLGRYGDTVCYEGHLLGLDNLHRILVEGGTLYLSVPIGSQRIEFNAHRVFSVEYLLEHLTDRYRIERFSYVDDTGGLHDDVLLSQSDVANNFGCDYGCGIFEMKKL